MSSTNWKLARDMGSGEFSEREEGLPVDHPDRIAWEKKRTQDREQVYDPPDDPELNASLRQMIEGINEKYRQEGYRLALNTPLDMLLWCPRCFEQHVDESNPFVCETCGLYGENECICDVFNPWLNPPHKTHRCNFCNHTWKPSIRPTNGVIELAGCDPKTAQPSAFANRKDFDDAVNSVTSQIKENE